MAASGVKGVETVYVGLSKQPTKLTYTVRLHFLEPNGLKAGQRVFDVALQGKEVLKGFDIAKEAGGPNRGLVRAFSGVRAGETLTIALRPVTRAPAVLCGVEIVAE